MGGRGYTRGRASYGTDLSVDGEVVRASNPRVLCPQGLEGRTTVNTFTSVANLCRAPEELELGGRACMKLRLADNTYGKSETRFFDAIVSGPDVDTAKRLSQGDQIVITGTLQKTSYKAKKGKMKGKTIEQDQMPFAKILQVTKSESFFAEREDEADEPETDNTEPSLDEPSDAPADDDSPLAGLDDE